MVLLLILLIPAGILLRGLLVMVGIGMLHSVFPAIPTISFGQGIIVGVALALIFSLTISTPSITRSN